MTELVMIGYGGHARVVADAVRAAGGMRVVGYTDPSPASGNHKEDPAYLGTDDAFLASFRPDSQLRFVVGLAGTRVSPIRSKLVERYANQSCQFATVVHPTAWVSPTARIDPGAVVLAGAIVNAGAVVGNHAIVNTGAIVEHDVVLGPFVSLAPAAVVGGGARIADGSFVGLGARIRDHIIVGAAATIGMGAVVVRDVDGGATVIGVPARPAPRLGNTNER